MWKCKHCSQEFDFEKMNQKANHSRWCQQNPNRNNHNIREASLQSLDRKHGCKMEFQVTCHTCENVFKVEEREKQFPRQEKYFCCRSCANSTGGKARALKYFPDEKATYITVAWRHHKKECVVCGETKIVAVHHNDKNHSNNDPANLIPLCPTHHVYAHSRYKGEVEKHIDKYITNWKINENR